jgi:hypothetical protein
MPPSFTASSQTLFYILLAVPFILHPSVFPPIVLSYNLLSFLSESPIRIFLPQCVPHPNVPSSVHAESAFSFLNACHIQMFLPRCMPNPHFPSPVHAKSTFSFVSACPIHLRFSFHYYLFLSKALGLKLLIVILHLKFFSSSSLHIICNLGQKLDLSSMCHRSK